MRVSDPIFPFFPLQIPKVHQSKPPRKIFIYVVYTKTVNQKKLTICLFFWFTCFTFVAENNSQTQQNESQTILKYHIMETRFISYSDAVKRFNNSLILCNNIGAVDSEIWDLVRFDLEDEDGNYREIMQFFITDCTPDEVRDLESWYGLLFTYSPALDCYILCVDHWGTSWNSVMIEDNSPIN